jgi:hypothetical protein
MQLIPRALVTGGFVPPAPPGQEQVTDDRINRIWSELAPSHGFTQLQIAPDRSNANFVGRTPDDAITIQPPLIQVRSLITVTAEQAAHDAQSSFGVILRHLGVGQLFNLGIRHVYNAPLPDNDARGFLLRRVLSVEDGGVAELASGSTGLWGGVVYVIPLPDRQYTLKLEPSQLDEMRSVYIDLDAQFPGELALDLITRRAAEAQEYIAGPVDRYLDGLWELQ